MESCQKLSNNLIFSSIYAIFTGFDIDSTLIWNFWLEIWLINCFGSFQPIKKYIDVTFYSVLSELFGIWVESYQRICLIWFVGPIKSRVLVWDLICCWIYGDVQNFHSLASLCQPELPYPKSCVLNQKMFTHFYNSWF